MPSPALPRAAWMDDHAHPFATITVNGAGGWQTRVASSPADNSTVPTGTQAMYVSFATSTGENFVVTGQVH